MAERGTAVAAGQQLVADLVAGWRRLLAGDGVLLLPAEAGAGRLVGTRRTGSVVAGKGTGVVSAGQRSTADATAGVAGTFRLAAGDIALRGAAEALLVDYSAARRTGTGMTLRLTEVSSAGKTLQAGQTATRNGRFQVLHAASHRLLRLSARTRHCDNAWTWRTSSRMTPLVAGVTTGQYSPADISTGVWRKPRVELRIFLFSAVTEVPVGDRCEFFQTVFARPVARNGRCRLLILESFGDFLLQTHLSP